MDQNHEWRVGSNWEEPTLGTSSKTCKQEYYRNQVGLQKNVNENGKVIRNKARLVCKGYAQVEGIDFEETFAHVALIEATIMFLTFPCYRKFKVYQIDVKSEFLNGKLEEEVYNEKPEGFLIS